MIKNACGMITKKILYPLVLLSFLAGLGLPFAQPVYAGTQDRAIQGEGSQTDGVYIPAGGDYTNLNSPDGNTSYISSCYGLGTWHHCYNMVDFAEPAASIDSVTLTFSWAATSITNVGATPYVRIGGINYYGMQKWGATAYVYQTDTQSFDGFGSLADLNNAEWGVKTRVYAGGGYDSQISYLKITVNYTPPSAPTVTTQAATNVQPTSCTGNGNITVTGGANATRRGFCYMVGTSGDPTTANSIAYDDGSFGAGAYTKGIVSLTANTGYRVRAYATNATGTGYGTTVQMTTGGVPTVTTSAASLIACTTATLNGSITATGGENNDDRGFVWAITAQAEPSSATAPPATYTWHSHDPGSWDISSFSYGATTLTEGQIYYARAWSHNSAGYKYGNEVNFTCWYDPTITTNAATDITVSTARLQSYLNDGGGATCQVRFGWGTNNAGDNITAYNGTGSPSVYAGAYTTGQSPYLDIGSLISSTTYYFNVEAQNSCGADTGTFASFPTVSGVGSPSNVTAIPSATSVILSWSKGSGAPNTFIRFRTNACPAHATPPIDGSLTYLGTASTYTHANLTSGMDYCYYVRGYDSVEGYSSGYVVIHATTLAAGIVLDTTGTAIVKPSGMTQTPGISSTIESNIPLMPYVRSASTSTGIPMGSVSYGILLIVLTGLSYAIYRWNHSIEWIVVIWIFANWIAYPTLHTPVVVPIFVTLVGLGYAAYRIRSLI